MANWKNYDYECSFCGWKGERLVDYAERDSQWCAEEAGSDMSTCNMALSRVEISGGTVAIDTKPYSFGMITGSGQEIKGHTHHRSAPMKRRGK